MHNPFRPAKYLPHVIGELNRLTHHHEELARISACELLLDHHARERRHIWTIALVMGTWCIGIALACLCMLGCVGYAKLPEVARMMGPSQLDTVVKVESFCLADDPFEGGTMHFGGGIGSGVIIDARHVLTASHVVGIATTENHWRPCPYLGAFDVTTPKGKRLRMVVVREDDDADLALLEIASADSFGPIAPPIIGPVPPIDASVCHVNAFPNQDANCGTVNTHYVSPSNNVEASFPTHHGNSGGPVYDDKGRLVGITTALLPPNGDTGGYFTSVSRHREFFR